MIAHFVTPLGDFIATYLDGRRPGIPHVEVPSAPSDGSQVWLFPGWSPPAAIDLEADLRASRRLTNNIKYEKATQAITADYPQLEKDTWPTQDKESKGWVADPDNALTPWIDRAAETRGIDRVEYLRRTLAKAQQFKIVSAYLTGTRQKYEDQIKDGGNPVLDYAIPASLYAEMQAKTLQIMTTTAAELQELF